MANNKNALRKTLEAELRTVNEDLELIVTKRNKNEFTKEEFLIAQQGLREKRDLLLRIMEICVQRNRF